MLRTMFVYQKKYAKDMFVHQKKNAKDMFGSDFWDNFFSREKCLFSFFFFFSLKEHLLVASSFKIYTDI